MVVTVGGPFTPRVDRSVEHVLHALLINHALFKAGRDGEARLPGSVTVVGPWEAGDSAGFLSPRFVRRQSTESR